MAVRIGDITQLNSLSKFNFLAGKTGVDREIGSVCLADLEIDNNLVPYANGFRRGSFIITSLRDKESIDFANAVDIINGLIELGCAGIAYNSRMLKKLPKQALDLCDKEGFPIFSFDPKDVYIENVVFDIMQSIQESSVTFSLDREFVQMLRGSLTTEDIEVIARTINPNFRENCTVSYLWSNDEGTVFSAGRMARTYSDSPSDLGAVTSLIPYRKGLIVIVSMEIMNIKKRDDILNRIVGSGKRKSQINIVSSMPHPTYTELNKAFLESNAAFITANIEKKNNLVYDDIGIYKLLIPNRHQAEYVAFMNRYLNAMNQEQLETAIEFVLCGGDYDLTAERLICHRNTVRYRMGKIHKKTDPQATEYTFLENLSAAIRLYLIGSIR